MKWLKLTICEDFRSDRYSSCLFFVLKDDKQKAFTLRGRSYFLFVSTLFRLVNVNYILFYQNGETVEENSTGDVWSVAAFTIVGVRRCLRRIDLHILTKELDVRHGRLASLSPFSFPCRIKPPLLYSRCHRRF